MQNKAFIMRKEIRLISKYRALIMSKNIISILLTLSIFFIVSRGYALFPIYIIVFLHVLPPILSFAIKDYAKQYNSKILTKLSVDTPFILSTLKKKYHYSRLNNTSNNISFVFTLILLLLWQLNYLSTNYKEIWFLYIPGFILFCGIFIRAIGTIFYQIKFHYDVSTNNV